MRQDIIHIFHVDKFQFFSFIITHTSHLDIQYFFVLDAVNWIPDPDMTIVKIVQKKDY